ncbi:MAG: AAA family ATPase, partial [Thermoplasmata archaeon]|nr:AAA family ATPase [Thermoplasmata archaeon]
LRRDEYLKTSRNRFLGPSYDDYEKGNIIERNELKWILQSIEKGVRKILVIGPPASGKTVLIRHIAYKLYDRKKIFFFDTNDMTKETLPHILEEIHTFPEDTLVIIEDIHKNPITCNKLFRAIMDKNLFIILTSKPGYKVDFTQKDQNFIQNLENSPNKTFFSISPKPIIHALIDRKMGRISKELRYELVTKCGDDLWILTYLLTFIKKGTIQLEDVLVCIHEDLQQIEKTTPKALDILLTLSFFYRYEIMVEKNFLLNSSGVGLDVL